MWQEFWSTDTEFILHEKLFRSRMCLANTDHVVYRQVSCIIVCKDQGQNLLHVTWNTKLFAFTALKKFWTNQTLSV